MTTRNQDARLTAGDSRTLRFVCSRPDGSPIDLTGATARWWMAQSLRSRGSEILLQKTGNVGTVSIGGTQYWQVNVDLLPEDTADVTPRTYVHQCEVTTANGRVYTVAEGSITLDPSLVS